MSRTSLGVLPCLARQQTTLPISPTNLQITVSAKLWQAIVTFTRMEDAEEVSASCPNEKMGTADHCRYSTQYDAQHAAKMSVMQKIRTKFPRYDPLILCDIL